VAVPTLERLVDGPHDVVVVVSQPDRGRGRGRKRSPSPVAECALRHGLPLLRPDKVGEAEIVDALREHAPDLGVVVAFGQFIPKPVRELPSLGYLINAHASLLPRYRGAAPIARAILDGEAETGISVMRVEKEMDAGAVALVRRTEIREQENTAELTERLARLAADAIADAVEEIAGGRAEWEPQDASEATLAAKIDKGEGRLEWSEPTRALIGRIHALAPRPGAFTELPGSDGEPDSLKLLRASSLPLEAGETLPAPGTVQLGDSPALRVATGDGWLVPLTLQRSGGKAMDADAFLRGRPIPDGTRLGQPRSASSGREDACEGESAHG
jgi:methionyl-tRNA formyltransferase